MAALVTQSAAWLSMVIYFLSRRGTQLRVGSLAGSTRNAFNAAYCLGNRSLTGRLECDASGHHGVGGYICADSDCSSLNTAPLRASPDGGARASAKTDREGRSACEVSACEVVAVEGVLPLFRKVAAEKLAAEKCALVNQALDKNCAPTNSATRENCASSNVLRDENFAPPKLASLVNCVPLKWAPLNCAPSKMAQAENRARKKTTPEENCTL